MTIGEVIAELKEAADAQTKKTWMNHGAQEPCLGVKVEHMKKIQKRVKMDHALALELYDTGIADVMYLAGLIADDARMSKKDLQSWLKKARWKMISEYTVPWVASGSKHGRELALEWMDSKDDATASAGWVTYSSLVSIKEDDELDLAEIKKLLSRVEKTIDKAQNRTRYSMNGFVIAVGSYVKSLTDLAMKTGKSIGVITVDMEGTSCKVPFAPDYIKKVKDRGTIGKKRKSAKC